MATTPAAPLITVDMTARTVTVVDPGRAEDFAAGPSPVTNQSVKTTVVTHIPVSSSAKRELKLVSDDGTTQVHSF